MTIAAETLSSSRSCKDKNDHVDDHAANPKMILAVQELLALEQQAQTMFLLAFNSKNVIEESLAAYTGDLR